MKSKKILILSVFIFLITIYSSVFAFTEEEQIAINNIVAVLRANSKNQTTTWAIDDNSTKKAYFETDFDYNGNTCSYMVVMYWNNQCSVTFTDGVVVGKNIDSAKHDLNIYYYDSDMNCLGAKCNNLSAGSSISISGVNSYFYSEFTIKNNSGEVVEPFFQLAPQSTLGLMEILEQEKEQAKTMKEIVAILPLIIVVVVSLVGLRKALRMLLNILKTS